MSICSLKELLSYARERSPFYGELYAKVPMDESRLEAYPIIEQAAFWSANSLSNNRLLTGPISDAIVFRSGGTTGNPKFSVFSRSEWEGFTRLFGDAMGECAIAPGDRIGNLFYAGDFYASFLFIHGSIERARPGTVNLPLAGNATPESLERAISDFSINVLAGVPTTILGYAQHFEQNGIKPHSIEKIIFGGESMYLDQREYLRKVFPNARIISIGYASVDGGLLGYADNSCGPDEHRCFGDATIMEIVDDLTGEAIRETDRPGRLLLTNLTRKLMPVIRYPVGDRAVWVEESGQALDAKFRLIGRSEEAARVGAVSLYYEDMHHVLEPFFRSGLVHAFQLVITHDDGKDQLTLRLAASNPAAVAASQSASVLTALREARASLFVAERSGKIAKTQIDWVGLDGIQRNNRTGKLVRVVDRRK